MLTWARLFGTAGGLMQFVGVALVFWEVAGVEARLNLRPWREKMLDVLSAPLRWLGILGPRARRPVELSAVGASLRLNLGRARLKIGHGSTLKARMTAAETDIEDLYKEIDQLMARLEAQRSELSREIAEGFERHRTAVETLMLPAYDQTRIFRDNLEGTQPRPSSSTESPRPPHGPLRQPTCRSRWHRRHDAPA